jgi:hypothetical protein
MDYVVASTKSVNPDCKDITPDRVVAVGSVNPVIAQTAGDGVVPTEGGSEIVPAPAIDGVGSVRADDHVVAPVPMIVPDPVMVAFLPRQLGPTRPGSHRW